MKRFSHKVVVITGGSRGLGAATVRRFAHEGAAVVINYHQDHEAAQKLQAEIEAAGGQASVIQADVADETRVKVMFEQIVKDHGRVDVLVNNAGIVYDIPFAEKTSDQWRRTMDVNLNGVYYCTK